MAFLSRIRAALAGGTAGRARGTRRGAAWHKRRADELRSACVMMSRRYLGVEQQIGVYRLLREREREHALGFARLTCSGSLVLAGCGVGIGRKDCE